MHVDRSGTNQTESPNHHNQKLKNDTPPYKKEIKMQNSFFERQNVIFLKINHK